MQVNLLKAIKVVSEVDSSKERQDFFETYLAKNKLAKILIKFHSFFNGTIFSALMYYIFAARYIIKKPYTTSKENNLLVAIDYINEKRSIADFLHLVDDRLDPVTVFYNVKLFFYLIFELIKKPRNFRKVLRFLVKFEKKGTFLTSCRIAELLFLYEIAKFRINSEKPKGIAIASNYSPCACGLIAAAENFKIPSIYTFHSIVPVTAKVPSLKVDFACLYGENAIGAYDYHGGVNCGVITYSGLSGDSWEMKIKESYDQIANVGVFLTANIVEDNFERLLKILSNNPNVKEITVRPHPLKIANPDLNILTSYPKVKIDSGVRVVSSAQKCDLVIAGSSSVHVEVLKSGVPCLYWEDFDTVGPDFYGFIKDGIVCEVKDIENLDWQALKNFYSSDWVSRFQKLDYSYLQDKEKIKKEIKSKLLQVITQ